MPKRYKLYKRLMIALLVGMMKKQLDEYLDNLPRIPHDTEPDAVFERMGKAAEKILSKRQGKMRGWRMQ